MDICVDFDGTCVTHEFPKVGREVPYARAVLKELVREGHRLILFTMRSDYEENGKSFRYLTDAINWFVHNGISLYGVQENPTQKKWTQSPKAYGQIYIDDAALGTPLIYGDDCRPYVNWKTVRKILVDMEVLPPKPDIKNLIPNNQDFNAVNIANEIYPDSVKYDKEGRVFNRAISAATKQLRNMEGVIEVKGKHLWFWADFKE